MSVQAGILHFDDRHVSRNDVRSLLKDLEERGPDYEGTLIEGPLGMAFRGFMIAPEDAENQPMQSKSGVTLTFDGRLDARDDLARRVGLRGYTSVSDAELTCNSYDLLGSACFEELIGEFALALWDPKRNSLFLVRSLCGTRPLYYVHNETSVTWSSELDDLVIKIGIQPIVNEAYAMGFAYYQPDIDESPFHNVMVVSPGTYVELRRNGAIWSSAAWHPQRISTLNLRCESEYEEAWREAVEAAIADRMRVRGDVWAELSGGFDSSTIAMMSDRISSKTGQRKIMTTSCTFETSTDCDESYFISVIEEARQSDGIHIPESALKVTLGLDSIQFTGIANPMQLYPGRYKLIAQRMQSAGSRVLLSGTGGDELFWSDYTGSPELADLVSGLHFGSALSKALEWSRVAGVPLWEVFLNHGIAPLILFGLNPFRPKDEMCVSWMTPTAKKFLFQSERRQGLRMENNIALPSRRMRVHSIRSAIAAIAAGYYHESRGIHFSFPYLHRRLIDFVLALPIRQLVRPGEDRSLMRRATRGLLPEAIRSRKSKGTWGTPFLRVIIDHSATLGSADDFEVCKRGFVEPNALARAIYSASLGRSQDVGGLIRVFALERWLRSLSMLSQARHDTAHSGSQRPAGERCS